MSEAASQDHTLDADVEFEVPRPTDLRAMRLVAGMTQAEATDRIGVARMTIYRREQEKRSPHLSHVRDLLTVYEDELWE